MLFVIPARGGSKGLPRKNLTTIAGIPLVGRAARTARLAAGVLGGGSRVICSTDDCEIAEAARTWGAEVPFVRPGELASDEASTIDVVRHALEAAGGEFEAVALLQPTSPLTNPAHILGALALFAQQRTPVVSVCEAEHPIEWTFSMDRDGILRPTLAGSRVHRRQLASARYRLNGAVYVAAPGQIRGEGFLTATTHGYVMPPEYSVDVDVSNDIDVVRALVATRPPHEMAIGGRVISPSRPCFVIAEAGVNHNGSVDTGIRLIDAAVAAGADAVKFQSFKAERLLTRAAPMADYQKRNVGMKESQFDMLRRLELDERAHARLVGHCAQVGIVFLSTPFDEESADLLEALGVPAFKMPSGEITNTPLLRHVGRKNLPVILSTGMSTLPEVATAVDAIERVSHAPLALLQCVSNYPADPADVNLRAMQTMKDAFGLCVGYSDHTVGIEVSLAAVAMGASIIEKHFTLDRSMPGPDHAASAEPLELRSLVSGIRRIESAMGDGAKQPAASEANTAQVARRSMVAAHDIPAGARIDEAMLVARRPGGGIGPDRASLLIGRRTRSAIREGEPVRFEMLE